MSRNPFRPRIGVRALGYLELPGGEGVSGRLRGEHERHRRRCTTGIASRSGAGSCCRRPPAARAARPTAPSAACRSLGWRSPLAAAHAGAGPFAPSRCEVAQRRVVHRVVEHVGETSRVPASTSQSWLVICPRPRRRRRPSPSRRPGCHALQRLLVGGDGEARWHCARPFRAGRHLGAGGLGARAPALLASASAPRPRPSPECRAPARPPTRRQAGSRAHSRTPARSCCRRRAELLSSPGRGLRRAGELDAAARLGVAARVVGLPGTKPSCSASSVITSSVMRARRAYGR